MLLRNEEEWTLAPGVNVRLIIVRHGEPEASARGLCYGKLDVGLSEEGREQIKRTSRWLAHAPVAAIYASPRRRARESAEIIAAAHNRPVEVIDDLCEIDFGEFEGLTYDEVAVRYPLEYRAWMEHPTEVTFPGGESFAKMRERVMRATINVRKTHLAQTVAIVAHGGVGRIILAEALRMEASGIFRLDQSYAAVSIIDYYEEMPVVRFVNCSP